MNNSLRDIVSAFEEEKAKLNALTEVTNTRIESMNIAIEEKKQKQDEAIVAKLSVGEEMFCESPTKPQEDLDEQEEVTHRT